MRLLLRKLNRLKCKKGIHEEGTENYQTCQNWFWKLFAQISHRMPPCADQLILIVIK